MLANHNYLPRSGKNIDLPSIQAAVAAAYNYAPTTFDSAFIQAQDCHLTTTGNFSTINLSDLAKHGHNCVEFDGSLSRNDLFFGDNLHFDPKIWSTMAKRLDLNKVSHDPKSKYITVEQAAKARAARVADAMKANPNFTASDLEINGSPGTTALYLTTLWDDTVGGAPKEWVKSFFGKSRKWLLVDTVWRTYTNHQTEWEKLPFARPLKQKTGEDIGNMLTAVLAVKV